MKWLAVCVVIASGCVAPLPIDEIGITADLATQAAYELSRLKPEAPSSDICENCHGTGKIGDGRIVNVCPECKGTGKR